MNTDSGLTPNRRRGTVAVLTVAVLAVFLVGAGAVGFGGGAIGAPIPGEDVPDLTDPGTDATGISSCDTISNSGLFELQSDINNSPLGSCINITTNDVIFDGMGHTIEGDGQDFDVGINVTGSSTLSNVTVRNVTVTAWGDGVEYDDVSGGLITNVNATSNELSGIVGTGSTTNVDIVANNASNNNFNYGFDLSSLFDSNVTDNVAKNNGKIGFSGGIRITFRNNTATGHSEYGFDVNNDNVFINNTASGNSNGAFKGVDNNTAENFDIGASTAPATTINFTASDVELGSVSTPPSDPGLQGNISRFVEAKNTSQDAFLNITFQYEDGDHSRVKESSLDIWKHNGSWTELGTDAHDTAANMIRFNVTNVGSTFAPLGNATIPTIDGCREINATNVPSNGLVRLTENVTNSGASSCIDITTDDVIFDGQGYTIDGTDSTASVGVKVQGSSRLSNVTVRNVTVTDWSDGVRYSDVGDGLVTDVTTTDNEFEGIELDDTSGVDVTASTASGNGDIGVRFTISSSDAKVTDTVANNNNGDGFLRGSSSTFRNNTARNNNRGFVVDDDNTLVNNTAIGNDNWDFRGKTNNTVENLDIGASTAPNTRINFTAANVRLNATSSPPSDPSGQTNVGRFVEADSISGSTFLNITFQYEDSDLVNVNESDLAIWKESTSWSKLGVDDHDTAANKIRFNVTNVGSSNIFAPLGDTELSAIDGCRQINASNAPPDGLVSLTSDITDSGASSCIEITTNDIIFDGQGHTVDADSSLSGIGINATGSSPLSNVTVRNVTVTDWGDDGIKLEGLGPGLVTNVTAIDNEDGIEVRNAGDVDIVASNVTSNGDGVYFSAASDGEVTDNVVQRNGRGFTGGDNYVYRNNTVTGSSTDFDVRDNNRLINNTANSSSWNFIGLSNNTATNFDIGASTAPNTTVNFTAKDVRLGGTTSPPGDPDGEQNIGRFVKVEGFSQSASLNITFQYEDGDVTGAAESQLDIWKYNDSWHELGTDAHDTTANEIQYDITDLQTGSNPVYFAPLAETIDNIAGCREINASNRPTDGVVNLTTDINDSPASSCIKITTDDVTFDGQGHTIDGDNVSEDVGINVTGSSVLSNITVRDVTVTDWDGDGIRYTDVNNGLITDVTVTDNGFGHSQEGVHIENSTSIDIAASNISGNRYGVFFGFTSSSDGTVTDTVANNNDGAGFGRMVSYTFRNATVMNNGGDGFFLLDNNRLINSSSIDNGDRSVAFLGSSNNSAENLDIGMSTAPNTTIDFTAADIAFKSQPSPPTDPGGKGNVSRFVNVTTGGLSPSFNVTFQYADGDVSRVDESTLAVWKYDGSWSELGVDAHDTAENEIRYEVTSFPGTIAPLGNATVPTIDGCREINATNVPGNGLVRLTDDITNSAASTCIDITTDDVVFDGQGYTIGGDGTGSDEYGIQASGSQGSPLSNVTIRNVTITGWDDGIQQSTATDGLIENVTVTDNGANGIDFFTVTATDVVASNASGNSGHGIKLDSSTGGNVTDTLANSNGEGGIDLGDSYTFRNNTARDNTKAGMSRQSNSRFVNNTAIDNDEDGFSPFDNNTFRNNTAIGNGDNGFSLGENNTLVNATAIDNGLNDFAGESNNTVENLDIGASTAANTTLDFRATDIDISATSSPPSDPPGQGNVSRFISVSERSNDAFLNITFEYEDGDVGNINESALSVWKKNSSWNDLGVDDLDTGANEIRYNVTNVGVLNTLAPLGDTLLDTVDRCREINATNVPADGVVTLTDNIMDSSASSCIRLRRPGLHDRWRRDGQRRVRHPGLGLTRVAAVERDHPERHRLQLGQRIAVRQHERCTDHGRHCDRQRQQRDRDIRLDRRRRRCQQRERERRQRRRPSEFLGRERDRYAGQPQR